MVRPLITYSESERGAQRITFLAKNSYTISKNNRKEDMDKVELRVVGKDCNNNCFYFEMYLLFIVDDVGHTMMFHVKKSTEMGKIKEMYSERYMIPVTSIDFFFDGRKIHDDDTPKGLELEEGDAIEVHKVSGGRAPKMPDGWKEDLDKIMFRVLGKDLSSSLYRL